MYTTADWIELEDETVNVASSAAGTSMAKVKEKQGEKVRKQAMESMAKLKADEREDSGKSAFVQVVDGFLPDGANHLNQCWLISSVLWHSWVLKISTVTCYWCYWFQKSQKVVGSNVSLTMLS